MKRRMTCALALGALLVAAPALAGEAFLDLGSGRGGIAQLKALVVGDIVTVRIVENSSASAQAKTDLNSKSEVSGGPGLGMLNLVRDWGLDTENKFQGNGKSSRSGNLQATISTRIVEIMPNGDYRLQGDRVVVINGEEQRIRLGGLVRPVDVRADNTVASTFIADAHISYDGQGELGDASSPGLLTRLVNFLF